jgi:multiple antibiotic resistance protein
MPEWLNSFIMSFVPLFIVIDSIGDLLFLVKATEHLSPDEQRKTGDTAVLTAAIVGLAFFFLGQIILKAMNISVGAFAIAGGIVLLVLSVNDLVEGQSVNMEEEPRFAVVPLGTPLLAGPATITLLLILVTQRGWPVVLISFVLNLIIAWGIFRGKIKILKYMGVGGVKAVSSVFSLLLTAIAVSFAIHGLSLLGLVPA